MGKNNGFDPNFWRRMKLEDAVIEHLAPLLQARGFHIDELDDDRSQFVKFSSGQVCLSFSVSLPEKEFFVSLWQPVSPNIRTRTYGIENIVDTILGSGAHKQFDFHVSDAWSVSERARLMAELLSKCGELFLAGDAEAFRTLDAVARNRLTTFDEKLVRERAHWGGARAWQERDLSEVIRFFERIEDELSPAEKAKLTYARKHLSR